MENRNKRKLFMARFPLEFFLKTVKIANSSETNTNWASFLKKLKVKSLVIAFALIIMMVFPMILFNINLVFTFIPNFIIFILLITKPKLSYSDLFLFSTIFFIALFPFTWNAFKIQYIKETSSFYYIFMLVLFNSLTISRKMNYLATSLYFIALCVILNMNTLTDTVDLDFDRFLHRNFISYYILIWVSLFFSHALKDRMLLKVWSKMRQANSKSKEKLLLSLSHELRNPINVLMNNINFGIQLFEDTSRNDKLTLEQQTTRFDLIKYLKICKSSAGMLFHTVSNIMDKVKLDSSILEYNPKSEKIYSIFERFWNIVGYELQKNKLKGRMYIDSRIPKNIEIDEHFLLKIMLNLKLNAIKHAEGFPTEIIISWIDNLTEEDHKTSPSFVNAHNFRVNRFRKGSSLTSATSLSTACSVDMCDSDIPTEGEIISTPNKFDSNDKPSFAHLGDLDQNANINSRYYCFDDSHQHLDFSARKKGSRQEILEDGYLKIEVYDSGQGIQDTQNVFKSNVEANNPLLGLGLGLLLTREYCQKMGGFIKVYSEKDKGSQFVAIIPAKVSSESGGFIPTISDLSEKSISVLVVDDDHFNREIYKKHLISIGITDIYEASNGKEGLDFVTSNPSSKIDFIIMDLIMPIMSGKECIKWIRRFEKQAGRAPSKIIVSTGNCISSEEQECLNPNGEIRANMFIRKPISLTDIKNVVRSFNFY